MKFPETDDVSDSEKSLDIPVRVTKVENMMTSEQLVENIDTLKQEKSTDSVIPFAAYYGKGQIDHYTNSDKQNKLFGDNLRELQGYERHEEICNERSETHKGPSDRISHYPKNHRDIMHGDFHSKSCIYDEEYDPHNKESLYDQYEKNFGSQSIYKESLYDQYKIKKSEDAESKSSIYKPHNKDPLYNQFKKNQKSDFDWAKNPSNITKIVPIGGYVVSPPEKILNLVSKYSKFVHDEIKVIFHVHLPEGIEKVGEPIAIVYGIRKEFGVWENHNVKLRQPNPQYQTYWKSDPVSIWSHNSRSKIQYKYAIHLTKTLSRKREKDYIKFEGNGDQDNRTLDIMRNNQFDIWKNNDHLPDKYRLLHNDFVFVDCIYHSIRANNLKNKIMEYQHLLSNHNHLTVRASNLKFILDRIDEQLKEKRVFLCLLLGDRIDELKEKRLFLCLLLGYHITRQDAFYDLPSKFPSELLLSALEDYKQEILPSNTKGHMYTAITTLVQHNAFQYQFDWPIIFAIAAEVDPDYTFIDRLKFLKYSNDSLLEKFVNGIKINRLYVDSMKPETCIKLIKWIIQICNMGSLELWDDVLLHDSAFGKCKFKWFIDQVQSKHCNDTMLLLELISQFHNLDDWFHNYFSDTKRDKIQSICVNWFAFLLNKLNTNTSNESNFIFSIFQQLESIYPLLGQKINIWRGLTDVAIERVKRYPEVRILAATKFIAQIEQGDVKKLFLDLVKELLRKTVRQIDDCLLNKIFIICDCKSKTLEVPNSISEKILCFIMTRLQSQSYALEHCSNILKYSKFWNIILNATGHVEVLNSNPFVNRVKMTINELDVENLQLFQQTLEYSDENLFQKFDLSEPKPGSIEFPFSYYFINQINYYQNYYYEELDIFKQNSDHEDDHIEGFRNNLISINKNFENLQKYSELYYNDFIKIILFTYTTRKLSSKENFDFILRHLMGDKIINDPFVLHIYWWKNVDNILVQLKLAESFPNIITTAHNDFIIYGKLDQYLFRKAVNSILQNICNNKPWKKDMDYILSAYDKIDDDAKNCFNLDLLLICNDLSKINSVPLEKIKKIIHLGKSTKNQEFITIDVINLVFTSLNKNNDVIPAVKSFISRSLELISLESKVRLTLYKNLFSREPFELVGNIIEKIFVTENQQNKRIFFKLIKNSKKALNFSTRLKTINDNIKKLDSKMAELCCEIIQTIYNRFKFNGFELNELLPYFKHSIKLFTNLEQTSVLQQITSIAFLKEFISKYWKNYAKEDNSLPKSLIGDINECMNIKHSFIRFLQSYFVRDLHQHEFFGDTDLEMLKKEFPWLGNIDKINSFPEIWQPIRKVKFEDFNGFYNSNLQNLEKHPFLSAYFKNHEHLKFIKHLHPIIRFVKILNSKLEFRLTRKEAQTMTFHKFIEKESINNEKENTNLKSLFKEFAFGWNSVMNYIFKYQSKEIPNNKHNKPIMNLELPVIFGLIKRKDMNFGLCTTILNFLIKLHNEFLDNVIAIPIGKCKGLNFLEDSSWDAQIANTYFIKSIKVAQAQDINFINYEWNDNILKYSQKNMKMNDVNFIFDLEKIEMTLARKLVFNKAYFEMEENQLYLKSFSFKYELFHNSSSIFFEIKQILPQEPISEDERLSILAMLQSSNSSSISNISVNLINLSELLFLFEKILWFVKELSIKNNEILISDFIDQWLKSARYNIIFVDILKKFPLKHIVAFYELIEEQVANSTIHNINDKFKVPLTKQMKDSINNVVGYYDLENQSKKFISAKSFALALKRFIYRFLLIDSNMEALNLSVYFLDFTLDLWVCDVEEELIEKLFPTCLLVSHAYSSYNFIIDEIKEYSTVKNDNNDFYL